MKFPDVIETAHFRFVNYTLLPYEDCRKIWEVRNDPQIGRYMVNTGFIPLESHLEYVRSLSSRMDRVYYGAYLLEDGTLTGSQCVNPINGDGTGESGLFIFPEAQGRGYGKLMKREFVQYLFDSGLLHTVTEKVKKDNFRNRSLDLSLGFRQVGEDEEYAYYELSGKTTE